MIENQQTVTVKSVSQLREMVRAEKRQGRTVGLVPTMGALHEGHISLATASSQRCDCTVATIFVNPSQFSPDEDLDRYPRTLDSDVEKLQRASVDIVFIPETAEIYPNGYSSAVNPPAVANVLEGEFRPTHFQGVCTIVLKLFNIVMPDLAFFGQKDFQQVVVLKRMVADLNVPVEIAVCPIVRADDGLAMSSRNVFFDQPHRKIATSLFRTLQLAVKQIEDGQTDAHELMAEMRQRLIDGGVTSVDYAVIADPDTLRVQDRVEKPAVILIAAWVGTTRLIDNCLIE